jgi:hypothetical protein
LRDSIISAGDTAHLRVVAYNISSDTLVLEGSGCLANMRVQDPSGVLVANGPGGFCTDVLKFYRVPPGDSLVDNPFWIAAPAPGKSVLAGRYEVSGNVNSPERGEISSPSLALRIQ